MTEKEIQTCGICLNEIKKQKIFTLSCKHIFCLRCINRWFNTNKSDICPYCKQINKKVIILPPKIDLSIIYNGILKLHEQYYDNQFYNLKKFYMNFNNYNLNQKIINKDINIYNYYCTIHNIINDLITSIYFIPKLNYYYEHLLEYDKNINTIKKIFIKYKCIFK